MKRNTYLLKNTVIFALGDFGTKFISFFLVPLYTNILTADQYGTADLVYTVSTVLLPFLTCNIAESILRFSMDKDAEHNKIMSISISILLCSVLAALPVIPLCQYSIYLKAYGLYTYLYVISAIFYQITTCCLRGQEQLLPFAVTSILHSLAIALLNIFFLVILKQGVEGYLLAYILANFLSSLFALMAGKLYRHLRHFAFDKALARAMVRYSLVLLPTSFLWWITNASDRIMVTAIVGAAANGIYAVSYKIPTILATVSGIFNRAWTYSAVKEEHSSDVETYTDQIYFRFASIVILAAAGFLMILKPFLMLYVGKEYYIAWKCTPFLILGNVFNALATFLLAQYTTKKDGRGILASAAVGAIVNVLLNIPFISLWGTFGAALATAISYLCVFVYFSFGIQKYLRLHVFPPKICAAMLLLVIMSATMFLDNGSGQVLLCLEFLGVVCIFRDTIFSLLQTILKTLQQKRAGS